MSNAREIAMKVIYDVEFNGAYSNMALKKACLLYTSDAADD